MDSSTIKVEIVIPVYNRRDTTLQALRSLSRVNSKGLCLHIIIVDDGSSDGTSDAISKEFPDVQIIAGDGKLHYAAGTNRGISEAQRRGAEYIVTANDDSIFHEDFLQRLISTARSQPRSVVGALLLLWDQPQQAFQVDFKWKTLAGGWQQADKSTAFDLPREPFDVEGLAGNCVLIPADAVRECGLMDEAKFPYGWGDIQYFVRMKKAGWRLLIDPRAYVWCEPNTNPAPLRTLGWRKALSVLIRDRRHPLNLHRQFMARWESAPTHLAAIAAYGVYLMSLAGKTFRALVGGRIG